jgi:hypothetical protein
VGVASKAVVLSRARNGHVEYLDFISEDEQDERYIDLLVFDSSLKTHHADWL